MSGKFVVNKDKLCKYVEFIFKFLESCQVGQGLFLNTIIHKAEKTYSKEELKEFWFILRIIEINEYIEISDNPKYFVKITQKGFDFVNGDEYLLPTFDLNLMFNAKSNEELFNELWKIIGKGKEALFYVDGPLFFYTIQPYLPDLIPQYSQYMEDLKTKSKTTSRIRWYRELFLRLSEKESKNFLKELSIKINSAIEKEFSTVSEEEITDIEWPSSAGDSDPIADRVVGNSDTSVISVVDEPIDDAPHVFISYAWEEGVNEWVGQLAEDLRNSGINAQIDRYVTYGSDLVKFMRDELRKSDRVLVIVTETYKKKAESGTGGASYEGSIISHKIYSEQSTDKFIPLLRKGTFEKSCPDFISGRKGIDFSEDSQYSESLTNLVKILKGEDVFVPPLKR